MALSACGLGDVLLALIKRYVLVADAAAEVADVPVTLGVLADL
jgi:hypothetical protein